MMDRKISSQPTCQLRRRQTRRGYTLLECIATLSFLMLIGISAGKLFRSVAEIGLENNQTRMSRAMIDRLSMTLRQDMRTAEEVSVNDAGQTLLIETNDSTIKYQVVQGSNSIARERIDGETTESTESFHVTNRCEPLFHTDQQIMRLHLTSKQAENPWTIEVPLP